MHDLKDVEAILDVFQAHGHYEVRGPSAWPRRVQVDPLALQIDTARTYSGGTSEEYLGKIDWKKRGLVMDTKLYPNIVCLPLHSLGW